MDKETDQEKQLMKCFRIRPDGEATLNNLIQIAYLADIISELPCRHMTWASLTLPYTWLENVAADNRGIIEGTTSCAFDNDEGK